MTFVKCLCTKATILGVPIGPHGAPVGASSAASGGLVVVTDCCFWCFFFFLLKTGGNWNVN